MSAPKPTVYGWRSATWISSYGTAMGNVVLVHDLDDDAAPRHRHEFRVAGRDFDRNRHHLIERARSDAQDVAARRQDDALAVLAGGDALLPLIHERLRLVGAIGHGRHEHGAGAGRHRGRIGGELFFGGRRDPPVQLRFGGPRLCLHLDGGLLIGPRWRLLCHRGHRKGEQCHRDRNHSSMTPFLTEHAQRCHCLLQVALCFGQHQCSRARSSWCVRCNRMSISFFRRTPKGSGGGLPWISGPSRRSGRRSMTRPTHPGGAAVTATRMPCAEEGIARQIYWDFHRASTAGARTARWRFVHPAGGTPICRRGSMNQMSTTVANLPRVGAGVRNVETEQLPKRFSSFVRNSDRPAGFDAHDPPR